MPFLNILGAIAIGTVCTMIVQSSSATIGITIALAESGIISVWTAVPIVFGDNIGTTVTALLASIGTNANARRAALRATTKLGRAANRAVRDLNRRPCVGLQASPAPSPGLRFNPTGFRRPPSHECRSALASLGLVARALVTASRLSLRPRPT